MRLQIRYATEFAYGEPVRESHNQLRACPAVTPTQSLVSYEVSTIPPGRIFSYTDYWGTRVDVFGIRAAHSRLLVTAESTVVTGEQPSPDGHDATVADYRSDDVTFGHFELLRPSPHARPDRPLTDLARSAVAGAPTAVAAVEAVHDAVRAHMDYAPGATTVGVDVNEVFATGVGVCQDFAHLAIAMYRSVGIPARYVSGYLYARDQSVGTAPDEAEVEIQTHAWVEALVPGWGWWALDPTNPQPVGERHVKIGHGRDYDDIPPLRGLYHGTREHALAVRVRMSREQLSPVQAQIQQQQ